MGRGGKEEHSPQPTRPPRAKRLDSAAVRRLYLPAGTLRWEDLDEDGRAYVRVYVQAHEALEREMPLRAEQFGAVPEVVLGVCLAWLAAVHADPCLIPEGVTFQQQLDVVQLDALTAGKEAAAAIEGVDKRAFIDEALRQHFSASSLAPEILEVASTIAVAGPLWPYSRVAADIVSAEVTAAAAEVATEVLESAAITSMIAGLMSTIMADVVCVLLFHISLSCVEPSVCTPPSFAIEYTFEQRDAAALITRVYK